jgi:translocation and assembly module TamB
MRRIWKILLILIPLLVIIAAGVAAFWRQKLTSYLVPVVESRLSQSLGREVRIGSISGGLVRGAVLRDVRIAEGASLKQGILLQVRRVAVRYRLRDLLLGGRNAAAAVDRVDASGAYVRLTRDPQGKWNIAPLFKPRVPPVARFTGVVNIADSTILYTDHRPPARIKRPLRLELTQVSGQILPHPTRGTSFRFAARIPRGAAQHLEVTASYTASKILLHVKVAGASLDDWDRRLDLAGVHLVSGAADVELTGALAVGGTRGPFEYAARAEVRDGAVRVKQIPDPLRSLRGALLIAPDQIRVLRLTGAVGPTPFTASGLVSGFKQPQLSLSISGRDVSAEVFAGLTKLKLPPDLRVAGADVELAVRGSLQHPQVEGAFHAARAQLKAIAASNVTGRVRYSDGIAWLRGMRLEAAGGQVSGDVWLEPRGGRISAGFEASGRDLDIAQMLHSADIKPARRISGRLRADVAGTYDAQGVHAAGSFEARDGLIGNLGFSSASGVAEVEDGALRISAGRIESPSGVAVVEGTVGADRALDVQVRASALDLAAAVRLIGARGEAGKLSGTGYFAGTISGTTSDPAASGIFEATDVRFHDELFEFLSGRIAASRTSVAAEEVLAYQPEAHYVVAGAVRGLDQPRDKMTIEGTVDVGYARLANVLTTAGITADVQGDVEASLKVGGTVTSPTASGHLVLHRPVWQGWAFDRAEAAFDLANDVVQLHDATARVGDSVVTASGQVSREGELQLQFRADAQLGDLSAPEATNFPFDLTGKVIATGQIKGTAKEPQIAAEVRSDEITVNGQAITDITVQTSYSGETGRNELQVGFSQGKGKFALDGSVDLRAKEVQVRGALTGGSLAELRAALAAVARKLPESSTVWKAAQFASGAPTPVRGQVAAQVNLSGPWGDLKGEVKVQTAGVSVADVAVPDATATLGIAGKVVEIRHFEARDAATYATASGTVDLGGPIAIEADAYNVRASVFEPFVGRAAAAISGSADLSLSVSGTLERPQIVGSMEVADLTAARIKVDHLQVPRFEVRTDSLVADEVNAAIGDHVVHAAITLPVTWKPVGIDRTGHWSIAVDLTGEDLALLTRLIPDLASASGALDGRVALTGSIEKPELTGAVTISRGALRLRQQQTAITAITGTIRLDGERVTVQNLTGLVGGGAFQAQGEVGVVTLSPSRLMSNRFDLRFTGQGLGINAGGLFTGKVNADLALVSPDEKGAPPVLRGRAVLASGQVGIPQRPEIRPVIQFPAFDPRLDIDVVLQPALRLRTPTISMEVSGTGHIGGRLDSPIGTAIVESRRGTVDLPGASFRISYASVEATLSPPLVPVPGMPAVAEARAVVRVEAESHVRGYDVYLSMSGPLTDPNVEPKISLRSVPDLDEERLWAMVTGLPVGPGAAALGDRTRALLTTGIGVVALNPLQRATASALGLEEFGVEYGQYEPVRVRVGRYLVQKLYATYLRSLSSQIPTWDFTLAYQVLPTLSLGARINERNEVFWEAQTTKRF